MPRSRYFSFRHLAALAGLLAVMMAAGPSFAERDELERNAEPAGEGGSLDDVFGGIGSFFGGEDEPEFERLEEGEDFSGIIVDRPRSLRIFHGYATGIAARPELEAYVNKVLDRLARVLPVRNLPVRAFIMGSDSLSAAAAPCGAIAIDWGLLRTLKTEDELAFVLAHEVAHVLFRHHTADWFVDAQHVSVTSGEIAEEVVDKVEGSTGLALDPSGSLSRAVKIGRVSYHLSKSVILPAWTRDQEDEADRLAIDLLVRAQYNHAAALTFFAKLEAWEKQMADPETGDPLALALQTAGPALTDPTNPNALIDALLDSSTLWIDELFDSDDHYPAAERRKSVQEYVLSLYKKVKLVRNTPLPWSEKGDGGETARINGLYTASFNAFGELRKGEIKKAEGLADDGITREDTWSDGYPRFAFYQVRLAQNANSRAIANIDYALDASQPGVLLFRERMGFEEDAGRWNEAARLLDEARRKLDDPPALLADRIRIYPQVGRAHELPAVLLECRLKWREQAEACEEAMEKSRL